MGYIPYILLINLENCVKNWILIFVYVASFCAKPVFSADIQLIPARAIQDRLPDKAHIEIVGEIVSGDLVKLQKAVEKYESLSNRLPNPLILLDSPGGNVAEALKMGRFLRERMAHTAVDSGSDCSSSCVFLMAGGVRRDVFLNGRIGLHRPRFEFEHYGSLNQNQARKAYHALKQQCTEYMNNMGISQRVFENMLITPSQEIIFIGRETAKEMGLVGSDPAWEEWERARSVNKNGLVAVEAMDLLIACYNSGANKSECDRKYQLHSQSIKK